MVITSLFLTHYHLSNSFQDIQDEISYMKQQLAWRGLQKMHKMQFTDKFICKFYQLYNLLKLQMLAELPN